MKNARALLFEDNVISLRTAIVVDDGNIVGLQLLPACLDSSIPGTKPKGFDYVLEDGTNLYRHQRSVSEEAKLMSSFAPVEQSVRPMTFKEPPEIKLVWADSGNGLVLYLNEEPWAFIDEETHKGYSKGVLKPDGGNPWNQELFEKIFGAK